ncbi:cation-translocating P-type ATPase [Aestuariispira ectoiniformans]|uniref:cation-translocating P-type ATPase n=1 Tax=Aestuariispira ectoiniformans TaxID=2775080 RepID=UPI00223B6869|nr:cation-transporting P-type ATPase [Aestuariispira ectoiniformans]
MSQQQGSGQPWHAVPIEQAFAAFQTSRNGLTGGDVEARLKVYGPNQLPTTAPHPAYIRFLNQFNNVLIYVLLTAAVVTAILGHWLDCSVILGVTLINAVIGFIQEGRAERALDAIRNLVSPQASLLRDNRRVDVPAVEIVPGDIVILQPGDRVAADLRLFRTKGLFIEEALLTGESVPVEKNVTSASPDAALGDRGCMAYSGTLVTQGSGAGIVVATGRQTEIGRIGALIQRVGTITTPLLRQMTRFGHVLTAGILALAAVTFLAGYYLYQFAADEMFLAAVGLAVAAIPEGLPAIITITMAIGVERMAGRHAIIRRLPAVETLGSVTVICSDKTGTFTRNEMCVCDIATAKRDYKVTGTGYAPHGDIEAGGKTILGQDGDYLTQLLRAAVLCNDASLQQNDDGDWWITGDPMEAALLTLALKSGIARSDLEKQWPRSDEIPFDTGHRFMATLNHSHEGEAAIFVKGAPERVLRMCDRQAASQLIEPLDTDHWYRKISTMTANGERVLALAMRVVDTETRDLTFGDVEGGLVFLGLFGLEDPPREEAVEAIKRCHAAGIRVKMITGDHAETAKAIAGQLGLVNSTTALSGSDLETMTGPDLAQAASEVDVFARTSPEQKLRLVEALQSNGEIVAMTGDGVNDAPALKRADVGIAMGKKGTEAAKEAARIVLADDNFASIAHAVEEGRVVYDNLKKAILYILPTSAGEAMTIALAVALGLTLPITPVQILWVNMVTTVTLSLALAFEGAESNIMGRPPRPAKAPLLSAFLFWRTCFVSVILVAGVFGIYVYLLEEGSPVELARTAAVNTLVLFEIFYLFNIRRQHSAAVHDLFTRAALPAWISVATVLALQAVYTYLPAMNLLFGTHPMGAGLWGICALIAGSIFLIIEIEKGLFNLRPPARPQDRRT